MYLFLSFVFIASYDVQFTRIAKGSGYKYVIESNLLSQYCVRNNKRYVKCDKCNATGYIGGDTYEGVDSFHNSFRNLVKVSHPSFYAFLEYLQGVTLSLIHI